MLAWSISRKRASFLDVDREFISDAVEEAVKGGEPKDAVDKPR